MHLSIIIGYLKGVSKSLNYIFYFDIFDRINCSPFPYSSNDFLIKFMQGTILKQLEADNVPKIAPTKMSPG